MRNIYLAFLCVCCSLAMHAQKQGDLWYFGNGAALDFSSGSPVAISPSSISTTEGCATVADANGNLMFYSDGITVWDATHGVMLNGNGLNGNPSSTQSGVAIPDPGNPQKYYLFTAEAMAGADGIAYSTIDMTLNGGLGGVVTKNNQILTPACEKITAVNHANGQDIWVIAHDWGSADFYAWLVTPGGVSAPVISTVGTVHSGASTGTIGYMKASPQGDRIALAIDHTLKIVEIFDFNNSTGVLSNVINLNGFGGIGPYGVEFSPNGRLLYISEENGDLHQFDLITGTAPGIQASKTTLATQGAGTFGAVQLANNGVIYITRFGAGTLDAILDPNVVGLGCNYQAANANLGSGFGRLGLPNFVTSFFNPASFEVSPVCTGDTVVFSNFQPNILQGQSYYWEFGDGRIDTSLHPDIVYPLPGNYTLRFIKYGGIDDTAETIVKVVEMPVADLGGDTSVCEGHELHVGQADSILWSTGANTPSITVDQGGLYHVTLRNEFCVHSDSVLVTVLPNPTAFAGKDSLVVCKGDSVPIGGTPPATGGTPPYDFSWTPTTGLSNHLIPHPQARPTLETDYILVVQDANGCIGADIVKVRVALTVEADAGLDILACEGTSVTIGGDPSATGGSAPYSYSWTPLAPLDNTILANPSAQVNGTRSFVLTVTDSRGCVDQDTMVLRASPLPIADAGSDLAVCPDTDVFLGGSPAMSGGIPPYTAEWEDAGGGAFASIANPPLTVGSSQAFHLIVTDSLGCIGRDTQQVIALPAPVADFTASPAGLTQHFTDLSIGATSWDWDFGNNTYSQVQHPSVTYAMPQAYLVTLRVESQEGCHDQDTLTLDWATSIESLANTLTLAPNPANGYVTIRRSTTEPETLHLFDLRGRLVLAETLVGLESRVQLGQVVPGVYTVRLGNAATKLVISR